MKRIEKKHLLIFSFFLILLFNSCITTKKHSQIEYVHDTIVHTQYVDKLKHDSVYLHDSIFIHTKNDTVYYTKYKDVYKYIYVKDTIHSTDTLKVVDKKEEVKVVENTATIIKNRITGAILGIILCIIILVVYYVNKRVIKKL